MNRSLHQDLMAPSKCESPRRSHSHPRLIVRVDSPGLDLSGTMFEVLEMVTSESVLFKKFKSASNKVCPYYGSHVEAYRDCDRPANLNRTSRRT